MRANRNDANHPVEFDIKAITKEAQVTALPIRGLFRSAHALCILSLLLVGCAGTSGGLVKAYPGPERPASEVSVIECGFSLAIVAIDENRSFSGSPLTCKFSLLPGKHAFRVRIQSNQYGQYNYIGGFQQKGDQIVEYELKPGKSHGLHAFEDQKSPWLWTISITDPAIEKIVPLKQVRLQ